jgi:hypothetical protein
MFDAASAPDAEAATDRRQDQRSVQACDEVLTMDLQKIIKHHRHEAEYTRRLGALVAYDFRIKAAEALEEVERRFGEAIIEGET